MGSPPGVCPGFIKGLCFVFFVVFCKSLFVLLFLFSFGHCMSFFDLRLLIKSLVSSNSLYCTIQVTIARWINILYTCNLTIISYIETLFKVRVIQDLGLFRFWFRQVSWYFTFVFWIYFIFVGKFASLKVFNHIE